MPAIYAHRAFGEELKSMLPEEAFPEIFSHPDSFALGLHGPDVLFYYHPLRKNAVSERGNALHMQAALPFFQEARRILRARKSPAADVAYLCGFVCHFALDSVCHPAVAAQMQALGLSHTAVEAALERAVLLRDGQDPVRAYIAEHIRASEENISAVATYCGVTRREAAHAIRSMVRCSALLRAPGRIKRGLLRAVLRLVGSRSVIDMIVPAADTPAGERAADALLPCYRRALVKAAELLQNYRAFLAGDAEPDRRFASNYESEETL